MPHEQTLRRVILLALLYAIPIVQSMNAIVDPDIWWHLRTGQWIVEHRAIPSMDVFSVQGAEKNWIVYSWLFEVIVYGVHAQLGLFGLVYFVVAMSLAIAFSIHRLVRHGGVPIYVEVPLVAAALVAIKPLMTLRPWLFTLLFFYVELLMIARARSSGREQKLWVLPILFGLWANLHIQFVYGLAVLGLLFAESLVKSWGERLGYKIKVPPLGPASLALIMLSCFAATFLTPFHYRLYQQVFEYVGQAQAVQSVTEFHAMYFRSPDNWFVLLLTMSAVFTLGWQRRWQPFATLFLIMGAILAFRARRDVWVAVGAAIYIVSQYLPALSFEKPLRFTNGQMVLGVVLVAGTAFFTGWHRQLTEEHLQAVVASRFPVNAVAFIKKHRLPGPLFNDYDWGGFLLWSLREMPGAVDGRFNLFQYERMQRLAIVWQGLPGWDSNDEFRKARLIISPLARPLASLLRRDPGYEIVYEDKVAVVFAAAR